MELSDDVLKGLMYINEENHIHDKIFPSVIQSVCQTLVENPISEKLPSIAGLNPLSLKISYSTLPCIFLECAKNNTHTSEMKEFLLDLKMKNERVDAICDGYKNSSQGKIGQPVFTIELNTQNDEENVKMFCTKEQLQDLVSKLQDACKSLERVASQT
ncbi:hypothetical protein HELRODRAFT_176405 [Helobdella robusta]|uniref:COMM domain-containing protein 3 n=1 Tax=Helobdella robusta TaxID=6412 RepID=T1FAH6_HELRO|nr:hypothetical protein HELRODRAFT_176405 [Helobdella robusta]ESO00096.1 hypothetical protein HELRODRAFT_176405 [Helobdella robusta]